MIHSKTKLDFAVFSFVQDNSEYRAIFNNSCKPKSWTVMKNGNLLEIVVERRANQVCSMTRAKQIINQVIKNQTS